MHQHIKVIHHSENILVMLDSIPFLNELVSLCMKINEFSTNINHVFFFLKSQKWPFDNVLLGTGRDSCIRQCVRLVAALSLHCRHFLQMSPLSETTSGTVSEHTRHVSAIYVR